MTRKAIIVWNEARNEGIVFIADEEGLQDAMDCQDGSCHGRIASSLGEAFAEMYEDDTRDLEEIEVGDLP